MNKPIIKITPHETCGTNMKNNIMRRGIQYLLLLAVLAVSGMLHAQSLADYEFTTGIDASKWVNMSSATVILSPSTSGSDALASSSPVAIGFSFPFASSNYTHYSVNTDGNLRLGNSVTATNLADIPFSTFNSDRNSPKINAFGCDGYAVYGSHYVKARTLSLNDGRTILVVEFCLGTYSIATRNCLYKWQIHLYSDGNIEIVFPSVPPSTPPAVNHQCGFCVSHEDGWVISSYTNSAIHFTTGSTLTNEAGSWFDANRYYSFIHPDNISCPTPDSLTADNISTNAATLSWTPRGTENLYQVEVGGNTYYTATNSYTVNNLDANSTYTAHVRAICGAGDTSLYASCLFHTSCLPISTLPYSNGFEDELYFPAVSYAEAFPFCWHRINDATGPTNYYPYINPNANYAHLGNKCLYWCHTASSNSAQNEFAILPPIDPNLYDISDLTLAFYAKTSSIDYHPMPVVGVMTDPTDASTFTAVHTFSNIDITTDWQLFVIPLANYNGSGNYAAIKWPNPGSISYLAIDDLFLTDAWCDIPINVTATATTNSITVSWEPNGGSMFTVTLGDDTVTGITDTFYTFTNLNDNTEYQYSVATQCAASRSFFISGSIRTTCAPLSVLPYIESYEFATSLTSSSETEIILPSCWSFLNADTGLYAIMPITDSSLYPVNHLKLSFAMRSANESHNAYCVVGVMSDPGDANSFSPVETVTSDGSTSYTNHTVYLTEYDGVHGCVAFMFPQPVGSSNNGFVDDIMLETLRPCPVVVSHNVTVTASAAIVSWEVERGYAEAPDCYQVTLGDTTNPHVQMRQECRTSFIGLQPDSSYMVSIKPCCSVEDSNEQTFTFRTLPASGDCMPPLVNVEQNGEGNLVISWLPGNNESSWNLDYRAAQSSSWNSLFVGTNDMSYTISAGELESNTEYIFRVTANCNEDSASAIASFTTGCLTLVLPFSYSFDNLPNGTNHTPPSIPCWRHINNGTIYYGYPHVSSTHVHSGTRSLYWSLYDQNGYGDYQLIVLPPVDNDNTPVNTLLLSFWAKPTSLFQEPVFLVGVMSDIDDVNSFELVDSVIVDHSTTDWSYNEIPFSNYTGSGSHVAIRANRPSGNFWNAYLDDINLETNPYCPRVRGVAAMADIAQNSATVSWNETNDDYYQLEYGNRGFALGTGIRINSIQHSPYTLHNLAPNSEYDVYIRGICDGDTGNWSFVYTFHSGCAPLQDLPFVEDFESATPYNNYNGDNCFLPCWTRLNNGSSLHSGIPYVVNGNQQNHTPNGSQCLAWVNSASTGYGSYLYSILPQIDTVAFPINTLRLSFWAIIEQGATFDIGVMENNIDTNFQHVETIGANGNDGWGEYVIDFDNFNGTGSYIAIRTLRNNYGSYLSYFDDITVEEIPPCPYVEGLQITHKTNNSAIISWSDTSGNSGWNIEYDSMPFEPGSNYMTPIHVSNPICTISNLVPGTLYHVYVYPDCPGGMASRHTTFSTLVGTPATVPYHCSFENEGNNGWNFINGNQQNRWIIGDATSNRGNKSMYISDDNTSNNYSYGTTIVYAFRQIQLDTGDYICSFDWKAQGCGVDYMRAAIIPDSIELYAGIYWDSYYHTAVLDNSQDLYLQATWQTERVTFNISTAGTYKIVFLWTNGMYGNCQPPAAVDNIYLIRDNCQEVSQITGTVTSESINLTWTTIGGEIGWEVSIGDTTAIVYYPYFIATGLQPNRDYTVYIRTICNAGDTSLPATGSFRTNCVSPQLPYSEDFDSYTTDYYPANTGITPDCWRTIMTALPPYESGNYLPQVYYNYSPVSHSGTYCYHLSGTGYHTLPPMPVPLNEVVLTFWDYSYNTTFGLQVGVMEGDIFVPLHDISNIPFIHNQHEVDFVDYIGSSRIIAFYNYNTANSTPLSEHYLDDIQVDYLPSCPSVKNITAVGSAATSLTIDWTDRANTSQWDIEYVNTQTLHHSNIQALSHPVTISGLDSLTEYEFYVRPICNASDTGAWSDKALLATGYCDSGYCTFTGSPVNKSHFVPVSGAARYSITETIIDSAELAGIRDIEAIAYRCDDDLAMNLKNNVSIWLQPTDISTFNSGSDFIALDTFTAIRVYTGNLFCQEGWNYFMFDNIYTWDGHCNLVVIVDDNSNTYNYDAGSYNTSPCNGIKTVVCSSSTDLTPLNPSPFLGYVSVLYGQRPTMKLISCGEGCHSPSLLPVSDITSETATLNWYNSADSMQVAIKLASDNTWPAWETIPGFVSGSAIVPVGTIHHTQYTLHDLQPATEYNYRLRAICDADDGTMSGIVQSRFVTGNLPCPAPTGLHTTDVSYTTASLAWTAGPSHNQWIVRVWSPSGDMQTIRSNTPSATIDYLYPNTSYYAAVRGDCGIGYDEGVFSDTIQFTTDNCAQVVGVSVTDITANSAVVSWHGSPLRLAKGIKYEIEYGDHNFNHGTGTTIEEVNATSHTLTGLESDHSYTVYVRALCDDAYGPWSEPVDFTTPDHDGINTPLHSTPYTLSIFPNPAKGTVNIAFYGINGEVHIRLVDINGRIVREQTEKVNSSEKTISDSQFTISGLAKGTYYIHITGEDINMIKKVVIL